MKNMRQVVPRRSRLWSVGHDGRGVCRRVAIGVMVMWTVSTSHRICSAEDSINFNRDIRPILSDKCFACHGADAANQDSALRLDTFDHATEDLGGYAGVVPGKVDESEVHLRIHSTEADVMPPPESNRILTEREKALLSEWIRSGGKYEKHWSFLVPRRPQLPPVSAKSQNWVRNPIDQFVAARLEQEGLVPAEEASIGLLMRRAALTLTGTPPALNEIDAAKQVDSDAYQLYVDQLLDSTGYAERQTLSWLDAARYADTDGYQNDFERQNWPWRDWVIKAFRDNMPFDDFTIQQIAGDMLPDADEETVLATAFNRNHRQNAEGGALASEFFVENVIDRVETTSTVWLGLTMGCARCHDHKFDPLSQREFFQLFAYFNNIGERGIGKGLDAQPTEMIRSPLVEVPAELDKQLEHAQERHREAKATLGQRALAWAESARDDDEIDGSWSKANIISADASNGVTLEALPDGSWLAGGNKTTNTEYNLTVQASGRVSGIALCAMPHERLGKPRKLAPSVNGNFVLSGVQVTVAEPRGSSEPAPIGINTAVASYQQPGYPAEFVLDGRPETGWAVFGPNPSTLPSTVSLRLEFTEPINLAPDTTLRVELKHQSQYADHHIGRFKVLLTSVESPSQMPPPLMPAAVTDAVAVESSDRTDQQVKTIVEYFESIDPELKSAVEQLSRIEARLETLGAAQQPVMVMRERPGKPIPAYLLQRGQYDAPDKSEALPRAIPTALTTDSVAGDPPADRLELARWLVSDQNPLTARVVVNRIWRDHFGSGLVKTVEDFGAQGEYPSHPELLDWLAVEFIESGWDIKAMHRLIVTSATYRQSSKLTPEAASFDPENRLLARGPRYRLDGFSIRDTALQASGLLSDEVGGPPVKPYQPAGLWGALAANEGVEYRSSKGDKLYRKSLYTYWKRAVNPPRQLIFDASGREACNVYVRRTNTPLQALVLMNDVTFVEAARHVAQRVLQNQGSDIERLETMYRLVTARHPSEQVAAVLEENLSFFQQHYADHPEDAEALLSQGESPRDKTLSTTEHAAWTAVGHLILNLDETISVQ